MTISRIYNTLSHIATREFADIVLSSNVMVLPTNDPHKLRLFLVDTSFMDIFISPTGRYSYHWDRQLTPKVELYRHDNAPHAKWRHIATFPKHFHHGSENYVVESTISSNPEQAVREFLVFVRQKLLSES